MRTEYPYCDAVGNEKYRATCSEAIIRELSLTDVKLFFFPLLSTRLPCTYARVYVSY